MPDQLYEDLRRKYVAAYTAADAAGIAGNFTEDCIVFPPDSGIVSGRAGLRALYEEQFSVLRPSSLTILPEEERDLGDWGYGAGRWQATVTLVPTGRQVQLEGKYLNLLKRQADGSWKIFRHTWNAPTQAAAMAASGR
jgi:uncharacterized protein (TIGR02246 family)